MRRNRVKKVMAVMLAAGMVSGLAACGGKTAEKPAATPAAKEAAAETTAEAAKGADAAAEELKAEEGAEIEIAYWEGSTSDKDAWDELIANLQKDHPRILHLSHNIRILHLSSKARCHRLSFLPPHLLLPYTRGCTYQKSHLPAGELPAWSYSYRFPRQAQHPGSCASLRWPVSYQYPDSPLRLCGGPASQSLPA